MARLIATRCRRFANLGPPQMPLLDPGRASLPASHGVVRFGQSFALPESRKAVLTPVPPSDEGPLHELRCMIVNAWKETLGVTEIGLDENVFDLGARRS